MASLNDLVKFSIPEYASQILNTKFCNVQDLLIHILMNKFNINIECEFPQYLILIQCKNIIQYSFRIIYDESCISTFKMISNCEISAFSLNILQMNRMINFMNEKVNMQSLSFLIYEWFKLFNIFQLLCIYWNFNEDMKINNLERIAPYKVPKFIQFDDSDYVMPDEMPKKNIKFEINPKDPLIFIKSVIFKAKSNFETQPDKSQFVKWLWVIMSGGSDFTETILDKFVSLCSEEQLKDCV